MPPPTLTEEEPEEDSLWAEGPSIESYSPEDFMLTSEV